MNINKKMKQLNTPYMNKLLKRGLNKIKRNKIKISDEYLVPLYDFYTSHKWKYQIDYMKDIRISKNPMVTVYAFNPKIDGCERADYYLRKEIIKKDYRW